MRERFDLLFDVHRYKSNPGANYAEEMRVVFEPVNCLDNEMPAQEVKWKVLKSGNMPQPARIVVIDIVTE